MPGQLDTLKKKTVDKPGRAPLVAALKHLTGSGESRFKRFEPDFLKAMWEFDQLVASGVADQGDIQNGKGDFFNDVLEILLQNCSGASLYKRPGVPGFSFEKHKLDVAYPAESVGPVQLIIETKAAGVPKHPRNEKQKHPEGRAGSADLEKRIKEASLKNIDIKAEAARHEGQGRGPTSDLASWLKSAPPRCYMFLSVRIRDENDLKSTIGFADIASKWFDECGLFCYGTNEARDGYQSLDVTTSLQLDRVMSTVCTALRTLDQAGNSSSS